MAYPFVLPIAMLVSEKPQLKCDSLLNHQLLSLLRENNLGEIRVIGECELPLTTRLCQVLCDSGVSLVTVTGSSFIASGKVEQILMLARMNLVKSLRLSITHQASNIKP